MFKCVLIFSACADELSDSDMTTFFLPRKVHVPSEAFPQDTPENGEYWVGITLDPQKTLARKDRGSLIVIAIPGEPPFERPLSEVENWYVE